MLLDKFELRRIGLEETYAVALFYQGFLLFSEVLAKIFFLTNNIEKDNSSKEEFFMLK